MGMPDSAINDKLMKECQMDRMRVNLSKIEAFASQENIKPGYVKTAEMLYSCSVCDYKAHTKSQLTHHKRGHAKRTFHCTECSFKVTCESHLKRHMNNIHAKGENIQYFRCEQCDHKSKTAYSLKRHMFSHTGDISVSGECKFCGLRVAHSSSLYRHVRRMHVGEKVHECLICDYKTNRYAEMIEHKRTHDKHFECVTCGYSTDTKSMLTIHSRTHTGDKPHRCEECSFRSKTIGSLNRHVITFHMKEEDIKYYRCQQCDYKCKRSDSLKSHIRRHTGEKRHVCNLCDFKTANKESLERHVSMKHTGQQRHKCNICGYKTMSRQGYNYHRKNHAGEKRSEIHKCDLCDYNAGFDYLLKAHVIKQHSGEKALVCSSCGYKADDRSALYDHRRLHVQEKCYKCAMCTFKGATKQSIKSHMRTHTGEKSHKCTECSYKSYTNTELQRHINFVHLKIKPFKCGECGSRWATKRALRLHTQLHKNERPFLCEQCGYNAKTKRAVILHTKLVHVKYADDELHKCHLCKYKGTVRRNLRKHILRNHSEKIDKSGLKL